MAGSFAFRTLTSDPTLGLTDPITLADASSGHGPFDGIDTAARAHLVGSGTLSGAAPALYAPIALSGGEAVELDVDFTPGNLRLYVLDSLGNVVGENDDSGVSDDGSPGTLDPFLNFLPPSSGVFFFVVTSFDNEYLGNWQFETDGTVSGGFQLDISAAQLPERLSLGNASDEFFGSNIAHRIRAQGGDDRILLGGVHKDSVTGGDGSDEIRTGDGDDVLVGGRGFDDLRGETGDDVISGGGDSDILDGGAGNDEIHGGKGADQLFGGEGDDRMFAGLGDLVQGHAGNDTMIGGDAQNGGTGNDTMIGDKRENYLVGGDDDDTIEGGRGDDTIFGGNGNDDLNGDAGDDSLFFEANGEAVAVNLATGTATGQGSDTITGIERIYGTELNDNLSGDNGANVFFGLGGTDIVSGLGGNDVLYGDDGGDLLFGDDGDDEIHGDKNNDALHGNAGEDKLFGGTGDDHLFGGEDHDELTGGNGTDVFVFATKLEAGPPDGTGDLIADFDQSEGDLINVHEFDSNEIDLLFDADDPGFTFIGSAAFSELAGELRYVIAGADTFVQGDTDGDGFADFEITLTGQIALVAGDFFL